MKENRRKSVLMVVVLFFGMCISPSIIGVGQTVSRFDGNILYVGGIGSGNYTSIQDAIDNASDGDTVFVFDDSSPYYENIEIDKSINLVGENKDTTVIDGGGGNECVVAIHSHDSVINGFTIQNSGHGFSGIAIGSRSTICNNNIVDNDCGILLGNFNIISGNKISGNEYGIYVPAFTGFCSGNKIYGNTIKNSLCGIQFCPPPLPPDYNYIFHNNFINNIRHAYDRRNYWDDGYPSGGNYWDDYTGVDEFSGPGQNISGSDGIGDTPYYNISSESNQDNYPLMEARSNDMTSPEITNVTMITSDPLDTEHGFGWENVSCTVTDNVSVDGVKIVLMGDTTTKYPMIKDGDDYYCNITISTADEYAYCIWADDDSGNDNTSETGFFFLPPNEDVDMNGQTHAMDLTRVVFFYSIRGPNGWIRDDVDNDGHVHAMDLTMVVFHYGEFW